ncbi:MAG: hypothetical protein ABI919_03595 [Ramlibacter sp.]
MMKTMLIRYKVKPGMADENQRLVEQVYAQLAREKTAGLRYQTFRLEDGVSFLHIATREGGPEDSPLPKLETFKAFVAGIKERCVEPPVQTESRPIGSYDGF